MRKVEKNLRKTPKNKRFSKKENVQYPWDDDEEWTNPNNWSIENNSFIQVNYIDSNDIVWFE